MKADLNTKFINELARVKDPTTFIGMAHLLGVPLVGNEKDEAGRPVHRDFSDICADVIQAYGVLGRGRKRELLNLLKKANLSEINDADRTKDSNS